MNDVDRFFDALTRLVQPSQDYGTRCATGLARNAMFTAIADLLGLGFGLGDNPLSQPQYIERWYKMDGDNNWKIADWTEFVRRIEASDAPAARRDAVLKECVGEYDPNPDYAGTMKHAFKTSVRELTKLGADAAAFEDSAFNLVWSPELCINFIDHIWNLHNDEHEHDLVNPATNAVFRGRMVVIEYDDAGYPASAQFPHAMAFPSPVAAAFYHRFLQAYYVHVVESYNEFGAEVKQLHTDASFSSLPSHRDTASAARRLLMVFSDMVEYEEEAFIDDWFGAFISIYSQEHGMDQATLTNMMRGLEPMGRNMQLCQRGIFMAMNCSVSPRISMALFKRMIAPPPSRATEFRQEWRPLRLAPLAAALPPDIRIAQTTQEYMSMSADKTARCPVCIEYFMLKGHLVRPVMFHKTHGSKGQEIWVDPVHPEEQARHGNKCVGCRKQLDMTPVQLEAIVSQYATPRIIDGSVATTSAIRLQSVVRGRASRRRASRARAKRHAFNAAFPPSRSKRTRSMSETRSHSRSKTRSKRHSAEF